MRVDSIETPLGTVYLALEGEALTALRFDTPFEGEPVASAARDKLRAYFAGDVRALESLPLRAAGTDFQQKVWKALREIPAGETISYGELARRLGSHPRAVGSANARNPVSLAIPCHRVIAKDGKLCGYAWGEERKRWLLQHERAAAGR